MHSQQPPVLESNHQQPTLSGVKTESNAVNGNISQIPGLSAALSSPSDERARGRRVAVRDSDSDYVKLAKQGGHKGLLWHEESIDAKAKEYKRPGWFCAPSEDDCKPSLINSNEMRNPGAFQAREPPFGTDNMSAWERGDSSIGKEKDNNVHYSQEEEEKLESPQQYKNPEASRFRRIVFDKNPAPVNMSKLLSFGYVDDKKPTARAHGSRK